MRTDDTAITLDREEALPMIALSDTPSINPPQNSPENTSTIHEDPEKILSRFMIDWYNPKQSNYELVEKAHLNELNFSNLLELAEQNTYAVVCLRIIYKYFHEADAKIDDCSTFKFLNIYNVCKLKNQSFKIDLLKLMVSHWDSVNGLKNYEIVKKEIENLAGLDVTDRRFFNMAFMLHENFVDKFEADLIKTLEVSMKILGDFRDFVIVPNIQLLLVIMKRKKMFKTIDFTLARCPHIKYNSTVVDIMKRTQEYQIFIDESFDDQGLLKQMEDPKFVQTFLRNYSKKSPKKAKIFKSLMFGWKIRNGVYEENFLEKTLAKEENEDLIGLIWKTFKLWQKGYILNLTNPNGKRLIEYVETIDDKNLRAFLLPDDVELETNKGAKSDAQNSSESTFNKRKYFLALLNRQTMEIQKRTLYDLYLDSAIKVKSIKSMHMIVFYMLEEKGKFQDVLNDESVPFEKLKDCAVTRIKNHVDILPASLFKVDCLVLNIIAYSKWNSNDENYKKIKSELEAVGIVYRMMFMIVEGQDESEFINFMDKFKKKISEFYLDRYKCLLKSSNYTSNFMFIFLIAAMKRNKRKIIDKILEFENFDNIALNFPANIDTGSTCNYVGLKMLQNGHSLGERKIPTSWITPKVMKEFLDSQISFHDNELIEVNCGFLLHQHTKRQEVESKADLNNNLILYEDLGALKFLVENENVKKSIEHPVVSTYIDLKSMKFRRIHCWNLWMFIFLFAVPFTGLFVGHFLFGSIEPGKSLNEDSKSFDDCVKSFDECRICHVNITNILEKCIKSLNECLKRIDETFESVDNGSESLSHLDCFWIFFCIIGLIFIIAREISQFHIFEERKFKRYFRKTTNWIEVIMLVIAAISLILFVFNLKEYLPFFSAVLVLFMTIEFICLIPISSSQHYTMILKNVVISFPKFFVFFGLMLVPFSFGFCIIFRNKTGGEFFENFQSFGTSLFKLLLMLPGEYSIEILKLNVLETIFVSFFVLTTFWLYALIIGFSVKDIKDLSDNAREKILEENAKKILMLGNFFVEFEKKNIENNKNHIHQNFTDCYLEIIYKWLLTKHVFIQKIEKIYVDINTKELSVQFLYKNEKIFQSYCKISFVKKCQLLYEKYISSDNFMNDYDFHLVREIINKRYDTVVEEKPEDQILVLKHQEEEIVKQEILCSKAEIREKSKLVMKSVSQDFHPKQTQTVPDFYKTL